MLYSQFFRCFLKNNELAEYVVQHQHQRNKKIFAPNLIPAQKLNSDNDTEIVNKEGGTAGYQETHEFFQPFDERALENLEDNNLIAQIRRKLADYQRNQISVLVMHAGIQQ